MASESEPTAVISFESEPDTFSSFESELAADPAQHQPAVYYIRNYKYGNYLDVEGGNIRRGTPIIGFSLTGRYNQKWRIIKASSSYLIELAAGHVSLGYNARTQKVIAEEARVAWEIKGVPHVEKQLLHIIPTREPTRAVTMLNDTKGTQIVLRDIVSHEESQYWEFIKA